MNSHYARVVAQYENRHRVKPGITGWAQINGYRGPINTPYDMRRRLELDLEYIEHWNLLFDLKILTATLFIGFLHKNAL